MQEIPWLTEALVVLATEGVTAAEAVIQRALQGATLEERLDVGYGWAEILVGEGRPLEAIILLDALIAEAPSPAARGRLWWRLARLLAATGNTERVGEAAEEALRLGAINDPARIQGASEAVGSIERAAEAPEVVDAHATLLGVITRSPAPNTGRDLLQLAWTLGAEVGEGARARGERELEAWTAALMSMISGMMGELDGAILLARHAADAGVEVANPLAFSEAIRGLTRWITLRDGRQAGREALEEAQRRWEANFHDVRPSPIAAWLHAWTAQDGAASD